MSDSILYTQSVSKSFGGLAAVKNLSLKFQKGCVHAIIGPNGAGKTTLINLLSGDQLPDHGKIFFEETDITWLKAHKVSQLGIGRSYQRTNIFLNFTCRKNVWLAAQSRQKTSLYFFKPARKYKKVAERVEQALEISGLKNLAQTLAHKISYGEQRQLEIAMLLAMEPSVLLLDEPLAGMSSIESTVVIELIKRLADEHCIILIEHDMDAVFAVANILTVMDNGKILASGTPQQIRKNPAVLDVYLGEEVIGAKSV